MPLPNGIEARSREEWLKLANSSDPSVRKQVTDVLRELGLSAPEYMPMSPDARVDYIMKKQEEGSGAATTTTSTPTIKKDKNTAAASSGGAGLSAADRALLTEINEKLDRSLALQSKIHDLLVVQIFTDPQVKSNAEELGVKVSLLGNG